MEVADADTAMVTVEATATADTDVVTLDAAATTRAATTTSVAPNKQGLMTADTTAMVAAERETIGQSCPTRAGLMLTKQAQTTGQRRAEVDAQEADSEEVLTDGDKFN